MAGGVGNIWGYQIPIISEAISNSYPNASQLLTNARFWKKRFRAPFTRANRLTNGQALQDSNVFFVFYKENTAVIDMDLSDMAGALSAVAVDTKKRYEELPLGELTPGFIRFEAPYTSDWAVAVGGPAPRSFVENDLGPIDSDAGLFRVTISDGDTEVSAIGGRESRRNVDPSTDLYMYFNVVGSYAYQGNRPEVEITVEYFDAGDTILRLQYDSFSAPYTTHPDVAFLTNTNAWKQKTWLVSDAYFGNRSKSLQV